MKRFAVIAAVMAISSTSLAKDAGTKADAVKAKPAVKVVAKKTKAPKTVKKTKKPKATVKVVATKTNVVKAIKATSTPMKVVVTKTDTAKPTKAAKDAKATKVATPVSMPTQVPSDASAAIDLAKNTFRAGATKSWWLMSAGIIWLLMFILKLVKLFKKMGKRWAYITVGFLSMAAMLLAKFGGGVSWEAAIAVLTSGPFMAFANDFIKRGILNKTPSVKE